MSGRSFLCDLWFSQTLRHKFDLHICLPILPKTKKFGCEDRGDLTYIFFSKVVKCFKSGATRLVTSKMYIFICPLLVNKGCYYKN